MNKYIKISNILWNLRKTVVSKAEKQMVETKTVKHIKFLLTVNSFWSVFT